MYSPLVIIILECSITTLLHLIIHKHESVPSTILLALHRLHLLLLPLLLLLMINALHIYGTTIQCNYIWSSKLFSVMISKQLKKFLWLSDVRLQHIQNLSFELICSSLIPHSLWPDMSSACRIPAHSRCQVGLMIPKYLMQRYTLITYKRIHRNS